MSIKNTSLAEYIWNAKYRHCPAHGEPETDLDASWRRVASARAGA